MHQHLLLAKQVLLLVTRLQRYRCRQSTRKVFALLHAPPLRYHVESFTLLVCFAGAAAMADCTTTAAATASLLSLRVGGAIGIFLVSSVGVMLPILANTAKLDSVFFILRAIGAGVVLATGFVHVLGGAPAVCPQHGALRQPLTCPTAWLACMHACMHVGISEVLS